MVLNIGGLFGENNLFKEKLEEGELLVGAGNRNTGIGVGKCRLKNSNTQSITNNDWTLITWDEEVFDTDDLHSTTLNTARITIKDEGYYQITGSIGFAINGTGIRGILMCKNGETIGTSTGLAENLQNAIPTYENVVNTTTLSYLIKGDYIVLFAYQNSGTPLNTDNSEVIHNFNIVRIL